MMFMISGRATNANGSMIVRDGVVAAIHEAGHSVVTAQPRRGSYSYVDYLVATRDSINRRVTKVRWAAERNIPVIDYTQLWDLINNGHQPTIRELPADAAEALPRRQTTRQALADVHRQEAAERLAAAARETLMEQQQDAREQEIVDQRLAEIRREAAASAPPESAGTYNSETETTRERAVRPKAPEPVVGKPRRRKIVTGR